MDSLHTFPQVLEHIEENYSNPKAFNYLEGNQWKSLSSEAFVFDVKRLVHGLKALGLRRGDKVGILAEPSPQWTVADFAIVIAGGISVPLFAKISDESFIYECAQANTRFIFVKGKDQWKLYEEHRNLFEKVIALDEPSEDLPEAMKYHDVLKMGEELWEQKPKMWEEMKNQVQSDDLCTIIYTSGSTGMPKGVQLTNKNLCHLICAEIFRWNESNDRYLSILPLAHVFARQINMILLSWDVEIYYLNDLKKIAEESRRLQPTMMIVVPRILEKMYSAMVGRVSVQKNRFKRKLSEWAFALASNPNDSLIKRWILRPIADRLVYKKIRDGLGGRWRVIISGGAALDPNLYHFYQNVGFPIYEGWGLTEASTVSVNVPGKIKIGTVGPSLPGVKIKLGENDELLIGGPTVMTGYYRHPDATEAAIDEEGWLHTGDKGTIDEEGFVTITGRVKEQFKLSSGEYLSPGRIEQMLCKHPLIDMAMAIGERQKFASALFFPELGILKKWKKEQGSAEQSDEEFLESPFVKKEVEELLRYVNGKVHSWEKILKYRFILEPPTVENDLLTPTLKLRRGLILEKYEELIKQIYGVS